MAYNKSKHCVIRMKRYLEDMLRAERTITWPSSDPRKHAYHVREALSAATHYPEFKQYHGLKDRYKIRSHKGWVEAEWVDYDEGKVHEVNVPERLRLENLVDIHSVVGACIKFASKADEIYFPQAKLREYEKGVVYKWGRQESPPWKLVDHEDEGVTLTRKDVDEMFLWKPPKEES